MYFHLHRNSKNRTFYIVKIIKVDHFNRFAKKFQNVGLLLRIFLYSLGLIVLSVGIPKSGYFYGVKIKKILATPLPPPHLSNFGYSYATPVNFADFGTPGSVLL